MVMSQITALETENLGLRLSLKIGKDGVNQDKRDQETMQAGLEKLLREGASEQQIWEVIEDYKEKYMDYGRDRREEISFHLGEIESLLQISDVSKVLKLGDQTPLPDYSSNKTTTTKTAELTNTTTTTTTSIPPPSLQPDGGDKTSNTPAAKKFFTMLTNHIEVTPEQARLLKDSRYVARELDESLAKAVGMVKLLRERLQKGKNDLDTEFNELSRILTPSQVAKFVIWNCQNHACMHMLNELWRQENYQREREAVESNSNNSNNCNAENTDKNDSSNKRMKP